MANNSQTKLLKSIEFKLRFKKTFSSIIRKNLDKKRYLNLIKYIVTDTFTSSVKTD